MAAIDQTLVQAFIDAGENGATTSVKGKALEDLACYIFGLVPGVEITHRNDMNVFDTEEIDVAVWTDGSTGGLPYFSIKIVLIECKNWSNAVSSIEVSWFDTKLRHRGLDFGILITPKGITGNAAELTAAHATVAAALLERRRMIVITTAEIRALNTTDDLSLLIKKKLCDLVVKGTIA